MMQKEEQILIYNNSINFNFKNFKRKYTVEISMDGETIDNLSII